ncbi:polysaccharide deacetylase family protein [Winogradskyella maritima]|uniref:Polysaccharide deacetylase family protein n=1 Tax=Winogradskyella maritima TaxID=1517766 RepID=A0ABV8AE94_9FLAO|nr:polysaccharide deacetylase family protein [Winogradskyella maritima]
MKLVPAKTPTLVKRLFPNFIWNIDTKEKVLYLTFDDGPTPQITEWVLEILEEYKAKATFFCIGSNIEKHPDIFDAILKCGHAVGNHTYNHLKGWKHKTTDYLFDIEKTQSLINSKIQLLNSNAHSDADWNLELEHCNLKLFRPPYGKLKTKQAKQLQNLNYKTVMWDVLSFDWDASVSEEACLKNVTSSAKEGSVVVFHDSVKASRNLRYVLPKVMEYYSALGYSFKNIY